MTIITINCKTAQTRYILPGFNRASGLLKLKPQPLAQDQVLSSGTCTDHGTYSSTYSSTFHAAASHCKSKICLQTLKEKKKKEHTEQSQTITEFITYNPTPHISLCSSLLPLRAASSVLAQAARNLTCRC